jgi:2-dehydropantoate 2-reductase
VGGLEAIQGNYSRLAVVLESLTVEADQIIGDLVVRAHRAQVTPPLLAAAFTHLSIYQKRIAES